MGLRKRGPVPVEDMKYRSPRFTICETLRSIYHLAENLPDSEEKVQILHNARVGVAQAKAMNDKLVKNAMELRGFSEGEANVSVMVEYDQEWEPKQ